MTRARQRRAALWATAAFVLVLLGVTTGATHAWDRAAVDWFRPDDEWGQIQVRLAPIMDALEPRRAYAFLVLVTVIICLRRRDWRPAALAGLVTGATTGSTLLVKVLTRRPDPHGDMASTGGSYPSGHMVAVLACLGCCALLCWSRTRWWQWVLVAVPAAAMAAALSFSAAHWVSDVIGGALLAVAALCVAASLPLRTAHAYPTWGSASSVSRVPGGLAEQSPT